MQNSFAQVFSQRRSVFKAVSRTSACDPDILELRMAIDQEIAVPCIFVLAYARFEHGRMRQLAVCVAANMHADKSIEDSATTAYLRQDQNDRHGGQKRS